MPAPKRPSATTYLPPQWLDEAGPAIITRGTQYAQTGAVTLAPSQRSGKTGFVVQGTQPYTVYLHDSDLYLNSCTCPHASSVTICKHMVAAKLFSQGFHPETVHSPSVETTTTAPSKPSAKVQEIQANIDFLKSRSAEDLSHWIALQCDKNLALAQQLSLWRGQSQDLPQTPAQWKRYLTQAIPQRRNMWGREFQRWESQALESLDLLRQQASLQPANIRLAVEIALHRLFKIWESCDGSNGEGQELYAQLQEILRLSVSAESPPASWLGDWLQLIEDDPLGFSDEAAILALAAEPLRQAYSRRAAVEWQAIASQPSLASNRRQSNANWEHHFQKSRLRRLWRKRYLLSVQQESSTEAWLHVMQQTAHEQSEWIDLVATCERHQQPRLALQYARQGLTLFKDCDPLQQQLLHCYRRDGWDEEAFALAQKCLQHKTTDVRRLDELLECAVGLGMDREQQFQALLETAIQTATPLYGEQQGKDIHIALIWLLHEDRGEQALELLAQPGMGCSWESLIRQLALRLPDSHHSQAAQLLKNLLERSMKAAKSPYSTELQLVKQIHARLSDDERTQWLQTLHKNYQRKSSFVQGLVQLTNNFTRSSGS